MADGMPWPVRGTLRRCNFSRPASRHPSATRRTSRDRPGTSDARNRSLDVPEALLPFEAITFPKPGVYVWQVECAGEVIYERRIVADQVG
jgi:hypothetical protein